MSKEVGHKSPTDDTRSVASMSKIFGDSCMSHVWWKTTTRQNQGHNKEGPNSIPKS